MCALSGRVAIVTGATSGIGERIAEVFLEEGAEVVAAARREGEGAALERRLGVSFIRTDVAREDDVKAMVAHALARFGRVDCLVNNAGAGLPLVGVADIDMATFDAVMAANVRGVLLGMKHVAPAMLAQGSGSIVNVASVAGLRGGISGHVYTASKGAVLALTRSVAAELGEKGIRVNSISPGAIVTGIFAKGAGVEGSKADKVTELAKNWFVTAQPIPRAGLPEDVARAAVFLASDGSSFISGQDLVVDGGMISVVRAGPPLRGERRAAGRAEGGGGAALGSKPNRSAFAGARFGQIPVIRDGLANGQIDP
jgi:NAD(P)-dependent dehydrogenase (short-subunit alcohol dehydrogenase family)